MLRASPRIALLALALAACHSSGGQSGGLDDGGADACAPCSLVDSMGGTVMLRCGTSACGLGVPYECSREGNLIPTACNAGDAIACIPRCPTGQCDVGDQCGGTCKCASGLTCALGQCSASTCTAAAGSYCEPSADGGAMCCGPGATCAAVEGGAPACCALTGGALCGTDLDCCDPTRHCSLVLVGDAAARRICN